MDPILVVVAMGRVTKVDWGAFENQELPSYKCANWKISPTTSKPCLVHRSVRGIKVRECGLEVSRSMYFQEFANREISMEYAQLACRH